MPDHAPKGAPAGQLLDPTDQVVAEFDQTFGGTLVSGLDLAAANRLSFYIAFQSGQDFASPSLRLRARSALLGYAVFLRALLRGTSPPPAPAIGHPRALFFFEGVNPSVDGTLRGVLNTFPADEARAAIAYPEELDERTDHEWVDLPALLPPHVGEALRGVAGSIRTRQRSAGTPLLRRVSLRTWLMRMALRTAQAARGFQAFYDAYPTTLLVTASDTGFWGRCATLEAIRRGIPSLTLQHGMMVGKTAYAPVISTRFGAWGEASARWLTARGVPREQIVVTGAPRLDPIINRPRAPREDVAKTLGLAPSARWVILATNPIPFSRNAALLSTARAGVRAWEGSAILILKLHPSEDPAPYLAITENDPSVRVVPHGVVDLYDLLAAADVVLTFHSSVGLEAMLLDRPVVSLEAFGEENPIPYAREGAAPAVRNAAELTQALQEDVAPGERSGDRRAARRRFVRDNLLADDGKSAERVRDLIRALATGCQP